MSNTSKTDQPPTLITDMLSLDTHVELRIRQPESTTHHQAEGFAWRLTAFKNVTRVLGSFFPVVVVQQPLPRDVHTGLPGPLLVGGPITRPANQVHVGENATAVTRPTVMLNLLEDPGFRVFTLAVVLFFVTLLLLCLLFCPNILAVVLILVVLGSFIVRLIVAVVYLRMACCIGG